jgi:hypothetical protein
LVALDFPHRTAAQFPPPVAVRRALASQMSRSASHTPRPSACPLFCPPSRALIAVARFARTGKVTFPHTSLPREAFGVVPFNCQILGRPPRSSRRKLSALRWRTKSTASPRRKLSGSRFPRTGKARPLIALGGDRDRRRTVDSATRMGVCCSRGGAEIPRTIGSSGGRAKPRRSRPIASYSELRNCARAFAESRGRFRRQAMQPSSFLPPEFAAVQIPATAVMQLFDWEY